VSEEERELESEIWKDFIPSQLKRDRVLIARVLRSGANLLLVEPTNDLAENSIRAREDAL